MSGSKRQRELARAKYERQQARRAASVDRRRRNQRIIAIIVVVALVLGGLGWILAGTLTSDEPAAVEATPAAPTASATPSPAASGDSSEPS